MSLRDLEEIGGGGGGGFTLRSLLGGFSGVSSLSPSTYNAPTQESTNSNLSFTQIPQAPPPEDVMPEPVAVRNSFAFNMNLGGQARGKLGELIRSEFSTQQNDDRAAHAAEASTRIVPPVRTKQPSPYKSTHTISSPGVNYETPGVNYELLKRVDDSQRAANDAQHRVNIIQKRLDSERHNYEERLRQAHELVARYQGEYERAQSELSSLHESLTHRKDSEQSIVADRERKLIEQQAEYNKELSNLKEMSTKSLRDRDDSISLLTKQLEESQKSVSMFEQKYKNAESLLKTYTSTQPKMIASIKKAQLGFDMSNSKLNMHNSRKHTLPIANSFKDEFQNSTLNAHEEDLLRAIQESIAN